MKTRGFPIVLTADRTLMAGYQILFDGMLAASQTTMTPGLMMRHLLAPCVACDGVRAVQAPLGLRRVEGALLDGGFSSDEVAVVVPERLAEAIGPETRVVGVSSGDPLGRGMNSSTMTGITGGTICASAWFKRLAKQIRKRRGENGYPRVVMGGPGAWQLEQDAGARRSLGIDHVITGYCEGNVADVFRQIVEGEELPPVIAANGAASDAVPRLRGASVMGSVEVSRGCGWGCTFCTLSRVPMHHLPASSVAQDVATNVEAGVTSVSLVSEDFFRYGAEPGARSNPEALKNLLRTLRSIPELRLLQIDHANISTVAAIPDADLAETYSRLSGGHPGRYVWVNLGVETASGELLKANGGGAKIRPYSTEEWGDVCREQVRRLARAGFFPLVSLVMGLPGETAEDIEVSLKWVHSIKDEKLAVFPMFLAPLDGAEAFGRRDMSAAHWRLFRRCYDLNFKWIPRLYWDNQTGAGAPLWRRLLLQTLGRAQMLQWKALFVCRSRRLFA